ncbi:MAG TPA: DUF4157 domain-containing protein [Pyrinomonadaceae bacterium]|nr:DUF4157 domain-containing protein [Pyrinomonadaceae bacterium]
MSTLALQQTAAAKNSIGHGVTIARNVASASPQRTVSNQTMQRLLNVAGIQPKLTVNAANDAYEREADSVADQVMRMSVGSVSASPPSIQRMCGSCSNEIEKRPVQRMCKECDDELHRKETPNISTNADGVQRVCDDCEEEMQRKESSRAEPALTTAVESQILALHSGGEPLSTQSRSFFEPRFGRDFSAVRVHADVSAATTAQSVNALAYTHGNHIVFGAGQYQPNSSTGRRLLAHELTHVVQQRHAGSSARVQRACQSAVPATTCTAGPAVFTPGVGPFRFKTGCDDFLAGQDAAMVGIVAAFRPGVTMEIHGYASVDAPSLNAFNEKLACARANKARDVLSAPPPAGLGIGSRITNVVGHGPTPGPASERQSVVLIVSAPPRPRPRPRVPPVVKPGPRTPCERDCESTFDECISSSLNPLQCLATRSSCELLCRGSRPRFEVCARLLQPPVEVSGCNHAYIETPTRRYAIITPCTSQLSFAEPINGGVAIKTDRSPDPCHRRPTCIECIPKPGVTDLERCFENAFRAYAAPSQHKILGPNSNTFAGTLARTCCDNMAVRPPALGCMPGWDDPPAPARSAPCPTGPPVC